METESQKQQWFVYIEDKDYEGSTSVLGIVNELEAFVKFAKDKLGIVKNPIKDDYGRGSLHFEFTVKKPSNYEGYYHLVAEPAKLIQ